MHVIKKKSIPVIAIDGTAGSGKGTLSSKLSQELGWNLLDSGLLYRGLALTYISYIKYHKHSLNMEHDVNNINISSVSSDINNNYLHDLDINVIEGDEQLLANLVLTLNLKIIDNNVYLKKVIQGSKTSKISQVYPVHRSSQRTQTSSYQIDEKDFQNSQGTRTARHKFLDELEKFQNVTIDIRSEACANLASKLAVLPMVRQALLGKQREFLKLPGLIADGRDMGTVVFPNAQLKFFLDADPEVRKLRRYIQLKESLVDGNLYNRADGFSERDLRDSKRTFIPLKPAEDAICIDTTTKSIDEVYNIIMNQIKLIILR